MSQDTDEALKGDGAAEKVRRAFDHAPVMRTEEESRALEAWQKLVDAGDAMAPTAAVKQWERSLIGHLIAELPGSMTSVGSYLRPEHFVEKELGEVFRAAHEIWEKNRPLDVTSVRELLEASSQIDAPWIDVLRTCARLHTTATTVAEKATAVFGGWRNRQLAALGAALYHRALGASVSDAGDILDDITSKLVGLELPADGRATDMGVGEAATRVREDIQQRFESSSKLLGVSTGLPRLDYYSSGLEAGCLYLVKAGTGVGKSAFAMTLARNIAANSAKAARPEDQHMVAVISLEMKETLVAMRVLANESSVDGMKMRLAELEPTEVDRILSAERRLQNLNGYLRINHSPGLSLSGLRRYLQRLAVRFGRGPSVVIVDYAQLLTVQGKRSREEEVAEISTGLKQIADDLGCAVVVLSQVNADGRARESRRLEQDADMMIHLMPEQNSADPVDLEFVYDLVIEKSRSGVAAPRGKYKVLFFKRFQRIVERAETDVVSDWFGDGPGATHD